MKMKTEDDSLLSTGLPNDGEWGDFCPDFDDDSFLEEEEEDDN